MMKLTLNQSELELAITDFVAKQGLDLSGVVPEINIVAGRGANGITAEVDLENKVQVVAQAAAQTTQVFQRSQPAAVKQEQKPEAAKVEEKQPVAEKEPDMSRDSEEDAPLTTEAVNLFEAKADAEAAALEEEQAEQVDTTKSLFGAR